MAGGWLVGGFWAIAGDATARTLDAARGKTEAKDLELMGSIGYEKKPVYETRASQIACQWMVSFLSPIQQERRYHRF